jgi:hypothetical protein
MQALKIGPSLQRPCHDQLGLWFDETRPLIGHTSLSAAAAAASGACCVGLGAWTISGVNNSLSLSGDACSSRGEAQLVASQECNVARGDDHNVVCMLLGCIITTTISRGRSRLWPSGLQYNARHMQIAWPCISLCTDILAG